LDVHRAFMRLSFSGNASNPNGRILCNSLSKSNDTRGIQLSEDRVLKFGKRGEDNAANVSKTIVEACPDVCTCIRVDVVVASLQVLRWPDSGCIHVGVDGCRFDWRFGCESVDNRSSVFGLSVCHGLCLAFGQLCHSCRPTLSQRRL
jgi:hypothetical protein